MKLGSLNINGNLIMPAIAGYTDIGQRALAYRYGAALAFTEMISAKGLVYGSEHTEALLAVTDSEPVKGVQLFGSEPEFMFKAARHEAIAKFDIVDVNCGCPVPKIVSNGDGSALLKDIPKLKEVVAATVEGASPRPVTVKMRLGFKAGEPVSPAAAAAAEEAGAVAITVHGRTREQYYSGKADLDPIKEAVQAVKIPVIANGDVKDRKSAEYALEYTGAAGVAVGRGALGNPFVFARIAGDEPPMSVQQAIEMHIDILLEIYPEHKVVNDMKKHFAFYTKGMRGGKELKMKAFEAKSVKELKEIANYL